MCKAHHPREHLDGCLVFLFGVASKLWIAIQQMQEKWSDHNVRDYFKEAPGKACKINSILTLPDLHS